MKIILSILSILSIMSSVLAVTYPVVYEFGWSADGHNVYLPRYEPPYPCMVPQTGVTNSSWDYDDGSYESGVEWPVPLFTILANTNAVRHNLTGLIWARDANYASTMTLTNALNYCYNLDYAGYTDWRLPNLVEQQSLCDYSRPANNQVLPLGHPFFNVVSANKRYWSSMPRPSAGMQGTRIDYSEGVWATEAITATNHVWPVRGP